MPRIRFPELSSQYTVAGIEVQKLIPFSTSTGTNNITYTLTEKGNEKVLTEREFYEDAKSRGFIKQSFISIQDTSASEIEKNLIDLGRGNQNDNMKQVDKYPNYFEVELTEYGYSNLVFLETDTTRELTTLAGSRTLIKVANAAASLNGKKLGNNWDLNEIMEHAKKELLKSDGQIKYAPILLRPAKEDEIRSGDWYIQDGSHRALGYVMCILKGLTKYTPQRAFVVTGDTELY